MLSANIVNSTAKDFLYFSVAATVIASLGLIFKFIDFHFVINP
jgi:hypothetical protein